MDHRGGPGVPSLESRSLVQRCGLSNGWCVIYCAKENGATCMHVWGGGERTD